MPNNPRHEPPEDMYCAQCGKQYRSRNSFHWHNRHKHGAERRFKRGRPLRVTTDIIQQRRQRAAKGLPATNDDHLKKPEAPKRP